MTLEQLNRFCKAKETLPNASSWQEEPFKIDRWQIATNGHVLIAEYGPRTLTQLATLENCGNRDLILKWLHVEIPEHKYSTERLKEFLGDKARNESEYGSDPMVFNGYRVDGNYLRKVFALADEPYRFTIVSFSGGGRFHFRFGKIIAIVMGMLQISDSDTRYEPKSITELVSR